jgi:hypothetical protein
MSYAKDDYWETEFAFTVPSTGNFGSGDTLEFCWQNGSMGGTHTIIVLTITSTQAIGASSATLKMNAVSVSPSFGGISSASSPAVLSLDAVTVVPSITQNVPANPATIKLLANSVSPTVGALAKAVTQAIAKLQAALLTVTQINPIVLYDSTYISASGEPTTERLTAPSGAVSFSAGRIQDDENPSDSIAANTTGWTEVEWSLQALASAAGKTYKFRVQVGGVPITILITPKLTITSTGDQDFPAGTATMKLLGASVTVSAGGISVTANPATGDWLSINLGKVLGELQVAVGSSTVKAQAVSVAKLLGALNKTVGPATATIAGVEVTPSIGAQYVQAYPATLSADAVQVSPVLGGISIGTNAAVGKWQGVILGKSFGELTKTANATLAKLLAVSVTPDTGGQIIQAYPATASLDAVSVTPSLGGLSKTVLQAILKAQAVTTSPSFGAYQLAAGAATIKLQGVSTPAVPGGLIKTALPGILSLDGVLVTPVVGGLSKAVAAAVGDFQGVSVTPYAGGQLIDANPATLTIDSVTVGKTFGSVSKAAGAAVMTAEAVDVIPVTSGSVIQAGPAPSRLLGAPVSFVPGAISIPTDPAQAKLQANAVQVVLGELAKVSSPAGLNITAQSASVILGALQKAVTPAIGTWEGMIVVPDIPMIYVGRSAQTAWDIFQLVTLDLETLWAIQSLVTAGASSYYHQKALQKAMAEGEAVTLTFVQRGIHNPLTGKFGQDTEISVPGYAVEVPSTPEEYEENNLSPIDTTKLFFVPLIRGVTLYLRSTLDWAGTEREVAAIAPYRPDGALIAADLFIEHPDTTNQDTGTDKHITEWSSAVRRVRQKGIETTFEHGIHADVDGWAVEIPGSPQEYEKLEIQDKSPVTLMFVPATRGVRPVLGSTLTWDNRKRTVKGVVPIRPAGITIAAKVVLA